MGTSAIFTFLGSKRMDLPRINIFTNSDGYLEGGATYLLAMLRVENGSHYRQRGNLATRMLVANREHMELVGEVANWDIDYRYEIRPWNPDSIFHKDGSRPEDVLLKVWSMGAEDTLEYKGKLGDFVERYAREHWLPERYRAESITE